MTDAAVETLAVTIAIKDEKPLELNFTKSDFISDLYRAFDVLPQVHHHTSFDLLYQGESVQPESKLADLLSSTTQKSLAFQLKPKAYTEKSILEHLAKVRDIVGIPEAETFGLNSGPSKINDLNLEPIKREEPKEEKKESESDNEKKPTKFQEPADEEKAKVNELLSSFFTKLPSDFNSAQPLVNPAVRGLYLSPCNPVPLNYRVKGHLVYITLQTLEGETFQITGSSSGFYINKSSTTKFDPAPKETSNKSFTLYDLIAKTSKNFKNQIKINAEKLNKVDPITFLRPLTSHLSNPWITKPVSSLPDFGKTQFQDSSYRDFNDEYQSAREFPNETLDARMIREGLLTKTAFEFTEVAAKGALDVLNGKIAPMNPQEASENHIFLQNGIFYSYGVDAVGSFADKGGNEAARASVNQDLQTIKYLNLAETKGIYTLLTTIVDYAGKRVVAQIPVPGLFGSAEPIDVRNEETGELEQADGEPLTKINYGRDENEKTIKADADFVEGLESVRKALHFKKKTVDGAELLTNPEIKGMLGTDRRKYIIDLYNATPLDIEFIEKHYNPESEESYPHRQTVVRSEAVQQWWSVKVNRLITAEAKKQGIDLSAKLKEGEKIPEITVDEEQLLFSVDAFETADKEDQNVRDISQFITGSLIPSFIDQFDPSSNIVPLDGHNLTTQLHKYGINIRYLGEIINQLNAKIAEAEKEEAALLEANKEANDKYEAKLKAKHEAAVKKATEMVKARAEAEAKGEKYEAPAEEEEESEEEDAEVEFDTKLVADSTLYKSLIAIITQEMIARASKHILRSYSSNLPIALIPSLVSHFHNALFGAEFDTEPKVIVEDEEFFSAADLAFTKLNTPSVRQLIAKDVKIRYRYELPSTWTADFRLQREIAVKFGIQWSLRDYYFTKEANEEAYQAQLKDKKNKKSKAAVVKRETIFTPADVSIAPIIKSSVPLGSTGEQIFDHARYTLQQDDEQKKKEGFAMINESVSVYEQIYGQIHPEIQKLYASLSLIFQENGLNSEAVLMARRSLAIAERVFGLDSHETIISLLNLAYLEASSGSLENSIKVYGRITQIWSQVYNNDHVSIPTSLSSLVGHLQEGGFSKEAITLTQTLVALSAKLHGAESFSAGFLKFRLAQLYTFANRLNDATKEATESHKILEAVASSNHPLTKRARDMRDQIHSYVRINEANAKAAKQYEKKQAKLRASEAKAQQKIGNGKAKKLADLADKSVDEVLDFILGKKGSGKKNKNKNKD